MNLIKEVFQNIVKLIKDHLILFIVIAVMLLVLLVTPTAIDKYKKYVRRHDDILVQYLDLAEEHVYEKMTWEEFDQALADGKTFITYMGYENCHACQNVVPQANEYFKSKGIDKVYYVYFDFAGERETEIRENKMWDFRGTPLFLYVVNGEIMFSNQQSPYSEVGGTIISSVAKATDAYLELIK